MTISPMLQNALDGGQALKIISGLNNFEIDRVAAIIKAADRGGATFVDIAADPNLVRMAKQLVSLPVCVSAVEPELFVASVNAGADLIEIGNFDSFYAQGRQFEAAEVLALTYATRALLPTIPLSVTVPHILPLDQQVHLAEALVKAGANFIQTEGGTSSDPIHSGSLGLIEKSRAHPGRRLRDFSCGQCAGALCIGLVECDGSSGDRGGCIRCWGWFCDQQT